ncbi:MAG: DCC1-like thiol-disulfide oxidoreductase family protein, partial [Schleiferiaceae bacterium]
MSEIVVLFDGPCTLCNKSVDWIHSRDFHGTFSFASLQSKWAEEHLPQHLKSEDSVVLFMHGQFHIRSK